MVVPRGARFMAENWSPARNVAVMTLLSLVAFYGLLLEQKWLGILFMTLVFVVMMCNGFFMSHYLNHATASRWRATVLSFKGLFFNLAYGSIGFLYAALFNLERRGGGSEEGIFSTSLTWFPNYFLIGMLLLLGFALWQSRRIVPAWYRFNHDNSDREKE
jgi:uncharacterized membrane protein